MLARLHCKQTSSCCFLKLGIAVSNSNCFKFVESCCCSVLVEATKNSTTIGVAFNAIKRTKFQSKLWPLERFKTCSGSRAQTAARKLQIIHELPLRFRDLTLESGRRETERKLFKL